MLSGLERTLPSKIDNSDGKEKSQGGGIMSDQKESFKESEQDMEMATVREWRVLRPNQGFQM